MGKGRAPAPPDPVQTSQAQTGTNVATSLANTVTGQVNQVTPDGSLRYDQTGSYTFRDPYTGQSYDLPTFTATTTLSPEAERLRGINRETEQNLATVGRDQSARIGELLGRPLSMDGLPEVSGGDETRARVEAALLDRINPQLDRDRETLRSNLSAQGIKLGSEAYDRGMEDFGRQVNDARLGAILGAGEEASRTFGMDMSRRQQGVSELFAERNQPINEIISLLSGSQVQTPNFGIAQPAGIPTTDVAGNIWNKYGADLENWKTRQAGRQNLMGGLFGLGAGALTGGYF